MRPSFGFVKYGPLRHAKAFPHFVPEAGTGRDDDKQLLDEANTRDAIAHKKSVPCSQ